MNIPPMTFRFAQEIGWTIIVAVVVTLGIAFATFEPEAVTDWKVWSVGLAGQVVRAAATAVVAKLRPA